MAASEDASGDKVEKSAEYLVHRKVLDELRLEEVGEKRMCPSGPTAAEQVKELLR